MDKMKRIAFSVVFIVLNLQSTVVHGHGRFIQPPSRASMWRYGFANPRDYNDNEGFCGGLHSLIQLGGCGICGDALNLPTPRPHEAGGRYGNGIIVRKYVSGGVIPVTVQITANHRGYFTFRICPNNNIHQDPDQSCFDRNILKVYPSMSDKYVLPDQMKRNYDLKLKLPDGLECSQCIIQWTYTAGNNWGVCKDGSQGLGCGTQEIFRACSDVSISSNTNPIGPTTKRPKVTSSSTPRVTSTTKRVRPTPKPTEAPVTPRPTSAPSPGGKKECKAAGIWSSVGGMNAWCKTNCNAPVPNCPSSHCICR